MLRTPSSRISRYRDSISPVAQTKAAAALVWATGEMESRYRLMRELGVRNIDGYNRAIGQSGELLELRRGARSENSEDDDEWIDAPITHRRLPKIVIVIDELADLLLS